MIKDLWFNFKIWYGKFRLTYWYNIASLIVFIICMNLFIKGMNTFVDKILIDMFNFNSYMTFWAGFSIPMIVSITLGGYIFITNLHEFVGQNDK